MSEETRPVRVVFLTSDQVISDESAELIKKRWNEAVKGTHMESTPMVVLGNGLKIDWVQ